MLLGWLALARDGPAPSFVPTARVPHVVGTALHVAPETDTSDTVFVELGAIRETVETAA